MLNSFQHLRGKGRPKPVMLNSFQHLLAAHSLELILFDSQEQARQEILKQVQDDEKTNPSC